MRSSVSTFDEVWQRQFITHCLDIFAQFSHSDSKVILGCSGGIDSMLLLHLFAQIIPQQLHVIYIDHQLQQQSQQWADIVNQACQSLGIPYQAIAVDVKRGNLEAQARQARYQVFEQQLKPHDFLVVAHHQQDQAETVILRLLQGTGVAGLAAMREIEKRPFSIATQKNTVNHSAHHVDGYILWRPLLKLSRQQIVSWVNQLAITYVDDPMNHDQHYDRVWSRDVLWPVLQQRFPQMQQNIVRCSELMQDTLDILQQVLLEDQKKCLSMDNHLVMDEYHQITAARQRQLLSAWMKGDGHYRPPLDMVVRLQREVIDSKADAQAQLHFNHYYYVRYQGMVYRYSSAQWQEFFMHPTATHITFVPQNNPIIQFGSQQFSVKITQANIGLEPTLLSQPLLLTSRQGGEKVHIYGTVGQRALKKFLQEQKIPPWQRQQVKILCYQETMLALIYQQWFYVLHSPYMVEHGWQMQLESA